MKIGITERGDAGIDIAEWESGLPNVDFAILITKGLTDAFIKAVTKPDVMKKVIVHATCTGYGATLLEPNVHTKEWTLDQVDKLQYAGFPASQIVLRIDPIIPTQRGIGTVENLLKMFTYTSIPRIRYSFLDMYPHVIARLKAAGVKIPYDSFSAPLGWQDECVKMLDKYSSRYLFESCSENTHYKMGCISQRDYEVLGINELINPNRAGQRGSCTCPVGKTELLSKRGQCPNGCLYCYWR